MKNRSGAIDALRIVGILAIIAGHTWDNHLVRVSLYSWHVPLFFFLTGYLWTPRRPVKIELAKRARTLLIPYAVWILVVGALFEVWLYFKHQFTADGLLNLLWGGNHLGRPFSAFWFVTALFVAVILLRLMQYLPQWVPWVLALFGLAVAYAAGPALANIPLSAGVALPALIFVLAGVAFRRMRSSVDLGVKSGLAMFVTGALLAVSGLAAPLDMKQADFGTPVLSVVMAALICSGMLLLAERVFARLSRKSNQVATGLALDGFMVVLTHAVPLWVMGIGAGGSALGFAAAVVLPWVSAIVIGRTPMAPYLRGA